MANNEVKQKNEIKENKIKKHFFKEFKAELKKVIWPTPKQLMNSTIAVIVIVIITSAIVFVLDSIFRVGNEYGPANLQSIVKEKFASEEETVLEEDSSETSEATDDGETEATTENTQGQEIQVTETNTSTENNSNVEE